MPNEEQQMTQERRIIGENSIHSEAAKRKFEQPFAILLESGKEGKEPVSISDPSLKILVSDIADSLKSADYGEAKKYLENLQENEEVGLRADSSIRVKRTVSDTEKIDIVRQARLIDRTIQEAIDSLHFPQDKRSSPEDAEKYKTKWFGSARKREKQDKIPAKFTDRRSSPEIAEEFKIPFVKPVGPVRFEAKQQEKPEVNLPKGDESVAPSTVAAAQSDGRPRTVFGHIVKGFVDTVVGGAKAAQEAGIGKTTQYGEKSRQERTQSENIPEPVTEKQKPFETYPLARRVLTTPPPVEEEPEDKTPAVQTLVNSLKKIEAEKAIEEEKRRSAVRQALAPTGTGFGKYLEKEQKYYDKRFYANYGKSEGSEEAAHEQSVSNSGIPPKEEKREEVKITVPELPVPETPTLAPQESLPRGPIDTLIDSLKGRQFLELNDEEKGIVDDLIRKAKEKLVNASSVEPFWKDLKKLSQEKSVGYAGALYSAEKHIIPDENIVGAREDGDNILVNPKLRKLFLVEGDIDTLEGTVGSLKNTSFSTYTAPFLKRLESVNAFVKEKGENNIPPTTPVAPDQEQEEVGMKKTSPEVKGTVVAAPSPEPEVAAVRSDVEKPSSPAEKGLAALKQGIEQMENQGNNAIDDTTQEDFLNALSAARQNKDGSGEKIEKTSTEKTGGSILSPEQQIEIIMHFPFDDQKSMFTDYYKKINPDMPEFLIPKVIDDLIKKAGNDVIKAWRKYLHEQELESGKSGEEKVA